MALDPPLVIPNIPLVPPRIPRHPQIELLFELFKRGAPDSIRVLGHRYDLNTEEKAMPPLPFQPVERIYTDDNGVMQAQIANRWAAFTDDELLGIYSIVSGTWPGKGSRPDIPLGRMRDECIDELKRRRIADGR
jgi:hypothetical protein